MLSELVPAAKVLALLVNPNNRTELIIQGVEEAARAKGMQVRILRAGADGDFETAFASLVQLQAGALVVASDASFNSRRERLVALAAPHAVPAIYEWREFAVDGGLITCESSLTGTGRQVGVYVGEDPQRRQAGRSAGSAADQIRARNQPQDCQGARPHRAVIAARPRRRGDRMRRREFIAGLGGGAIGWTLAAGAQEQGRSYRVGFLTPAGRQTSTMLALFDELRINGFVEGRNLTALVDGFEFRDDQILELAAALVKAEPDAIVAGPEAPLHALQAATRTIPLIGMTEDMVGAGFVRSLARPDGNITGISLLSHELDGKRQELLIEAVPGARKIAALADSTVTPPYHLEALQHAALSRGVELAVFGVRESDEIVPAIDAAKAAGAEGLNFLASPRFSIPGSRDNRIVMDRIATVRLPAIFQWPETAEAGALAAYGPRFSDVGRQRARILIKVLRGTKPQDIPVEQPVRFEFVLNLQAARAIGHEFPPGLVARSDKVIE